MGQLSIQGAITAGPPNVSDGGFPSAMITTRLRGKQEPKGFNACSGVIQQRVAIVAPSWLTLRCIGPDGPVVRADTLYIRSDGPVLLRLTTSDGISADVVRTMPLDGLGMWEFPSTNFLTLLEVQGSATLEFLASGQQ